MIKVKKYISQSPPFSLSEVVYRGEAEPEKVVFTETKPNITFEGDKS